MKKVMRKRLKEDELASTLTKLLNFARKRLRELMIGAGAAAVKGSASGPVERD